MRLSLFALVLLGAVSSVVATENGSSRLPIIDVHVHVYGNDPRWDLMTPNPASGEEMTATSEKAHMLALIEDDSKNVAHLSLAKMFLGLNRNSDAIKHFDLAISDERRAFMKEYLAAEMLMQLYPSDTARLLEARSHLEKSLRLSPRFQLAQLKLDEINMILGAADRRFD